MNTTCNYRSFSYIFNLEIIFCYKAVLQIIFTIYWDEEHFSCQTSERYVSLIRVARINNSQSSAQILMSCLCSFGITIWFPIMHPIWFPIMHPWLWYPIMHPLYVGYIHVWEWKRWNSNQIHYWHIIYCLFVYFE